MEKNGWDYQITWELREKNLSCMGMRLSS